MDTIADGSRAVPVQAVASSSSGSELFNVWCCSLINSSAYCLLFLPESYQEPADPQQRRPPAAFILLYKFTLFYSIHGLILFDLLIFPFQASTHEAIGIIDSLFSSFRCYPPPPLNTSFKPVAGDRDRGATNNGCRCSITQRLFLPRRSFPMYMYLT